LWSEYIKLIIPKAQAALQARRPTYCTALNALRPTKCGLTEQILTCMLQITGTTHEVGHSDNNCVVAGTTCSVAYNLCIRNFSALLINQ
jgi:hypothetical protein